MCRVDPNTLFFLLNIGRKGSHAVWRKRHQNWPKIAVTGRLLLCVYRVRAVKIIHVPISIASVFATRIMRFPRATTCAAILVALLGMVGIALCAGSSDGNPSEHESDATNLPHLYGGMHRVATVGTFRCVDRLLCMRTFPNCGQRCSHIFMHWPCI